MLFDQIAVQIEAAGYAVTRKRDKSCWTFTMRPAVEQRSDGSEVADDPP